MVPTPYRASERDDGDPSAPGIFRCGGCDEFREERDTFCANCDDVTRGYLWMGAVREAHTGLIHMGEDRPLREIARDLVLHAEAVREDELDLLGRIVGEVFGPGSVHSQREAQS